jgi:uncharacterized alkaline shock family protein YloU
VTAPAVPAPAVPAPAGTASGGPAAAVGPAAVDPGGRGRTRIADRVVEKIAARAVAEVDDAGGAARRVLGVRVGADGDGRARVTAAVDGGVVLVQAAMAVRWPAPVRAVTRQVRAHVTERVHELTGLRVAEVDIEVTALVEVR